MGKTKACQSGPEKNVPAAAKNVPCPDASFSPTHHAAAGRAARARLCTPGQLVEMGVAEKRLPLPLVYRELLQLESKRMAGFSFAKSEGEDPHGRSIT